MKKIKAEIVILGEGTAAMFAAARALNRGFSVALVNPFGGFSINDLRPRDGLSLWNAAYRSSAPNVALPRLWDELKLRVKECLPVALENAGLIKGESWSVLSSTPVHRKETAFFEKEFLRLERKPWTAGQVRLLNPDFVEMKFKSLGLKLNQVAAVEGAVHRQHAISWDAPAMGRRLSEFLFHKARDGSLTRIVDAEIESKVGRRLMLNSRSEEISLEYEQTCLVFLTGGMLGPMKALLKQALASETGAWLQSTRKRRREQNFAWFSKVPNTRLTHDPSVKEEGFWAELGSTSYRWNNSSGMATWVSRSGPDGTETVVDEALRMNGRCFSRAMRSFFLEWEWKSPQWRETGYETYWATAFEGDLWSIMELIWSLPE